MELEIISPDKSLYHGKVKAVYVPGTNGGLGILENHAALITTLKAGDIRIETEQDKKSFSVNGGVIEVLKNKVIILAE